jgi:hypothetical protein
MFYRPSRFNELSAVARWIAPTSADSTQWSSAWRSWMVEERATLFVVDDGAALPAAFVTTVFVRGDEVEALRADREPVRTLYEAESAGRSLVLAQDAICEHGGRGSLHLLVLHAELRNRDFENDGSRLALAAAARGFYFFHMGYGLATLSYAAEDASMVTGVAPQTGIRSHESCLVTLSGATVDAGALNMTSFLFHARTPRFYFTRAQRDLLTRALLGDGDAEAAAALAVSVDAVKRAWRGAFQRVAEVAPGLLGSSNERRGSVRGVEKRRRLLEYLRTNLVELRPFPAPQSITPAHAS